MAKLFAAVIPNTECDDRTKYAVDMAEIVNYECNCKLEPNGRDANYYEICFGKDERMARTTLEFIRDGFCGQMDLFFEDPIMMSVYGLYKVKILPDHVTLEQFINEEAG